MQQAGQQVRDRHKQHDRRHDVVGHAAVDDVTGFIQDETGYQHIAGDWNSVYVTYPLNDVKNSGF